MIKYSIKPKQIPLPFLVLKLPGNGVWFLLGVMPFKRECCHFALRIFFPYILRYQKHSPSAENRGTIGDMSLIW
jgi:hypothetical protein